MSRTIAVFAVLFAVLFAQVSPVLADKPTPAATPSANTPTDPTDKPGRSNPDENGRGPERDNGADDPAAELAPHSNNGCGNDSDRLDDNEGWCGRKPTRTPAPTSTPDPTRPAVTPTTTPIAVTDPTRPTTTPGATPDPIEPTSTPTEPTADPDPVLPVGGGDACEPTDGRTYNADHVRTVIVTRTVTVYVERYTADGGADFVLDSVLFAWFIASSLIILVVLTIAEYIRRRRIE